LPYGRPNLALAVLLVHPNNNNNNCFMALLILYDTTRVSWYRKKHSPTHTYRGHQSSSIHFVHPPPSTKIKEQKRLTLTPKVYEKHNLDTKTQTT